jgi:two-component system, OmpR family, sensor kinase
VSLSRLPVRVRLVAGFALAMVIVLAGAGAFVFWRVQYALDRRLGADLASQISVLRRAARQRPPQAALAGLAAQGRDAQLLAADGRILASGSGPAVRRRLLTAPQVRTARERDVRATRGNLFSARGAHVRILAGPVSATGAGGAAVAVTTVGLDQRDEALRELLLQLVTANLVALALASLVGYRLARGALDPVERYRAQAERITLGARGLRLDVPAGPEDEISRLGTTLNDMLDAQERATERQQQFIADASHELRTPLGALTAEVDLALNRPRRAEELTAALGRIATDAARLVDLTDELLTLGSLGDAVPSMASMPAKQVLADAAARARAQLGDEPSRPLIADAPEDAIVTGDGSLIARALGNLVDNAVRHGGGPITLSFAALGGPAGAVILRVHDGGAELDPAFLSHAAERFRRGESSRTGPGTGLGLALVDAIATAHHGQLRICANGAHHRQPCVDPELARVPCRHPEQGATVSLLLPGHRARGVGGGDGVVAPRPDAPA